MSMVLKNNMAAMCAMNELNRNTNRLGKSLKKVSTGSKINSAADDASGYSIGEGMKKQIRALEQDQRNTQNGTSLLKVAEGAISSTVDILRTMKEKAVNAANDTNTDADRATIQKELDQSIDQIDDNANITFNGQYLIDGSKNGQVTATRTTLTNSHLNIAATDYLTEMTDKAGDSLCIKDTDNVQLSFVVDGNTYITSFKADKVMFENIIDKANYLYSEGAIKEALKVKQSRLDAAKLAKDTAINAKKVAYYAADAAYTEAKKDPLDPSLPDLAQAVADTLKAWKDEIPVQEKIEKEEIEAAQKEYEEKTKDLLVIQANYSVTSYIGIDAGGNSVYTADGDNAVSIRANTAGVKKQLAGFTITITDNTGRVNTAANTVLDDFAETIRGENDSVDNSIVIHTGTESSQNMKLRLTNMKSEALGLRGTAGNNLSVVTQKNANAAINVFDNAIQKALDQQTSIGAMQSRLEATFNNLVTGTENTISAQSVIQDADMAKEMTEYTKHNVLMQAAQSMLSQANQQSSGALSLLQG